MSRWHTLCIAAALAAVSAAATAQDDHKAHHPDGAASAAAPQSTPQPAPQPASNAAAGMPDMAAMDKHMKAMQQMHAKMTAAKTPAERQALMAEHMKRMHEDGTCMAMMSSMMQGAGPMPMAPPAATK